MILRLQHLIGRFRFMQDGVLFLVFLPHGGILVLERWPRLVVFRLAVVVLLLKAECGQLVFCFARMSLTIMSTLLSSAALWMVCRALGTVILDPQKRQLLFNGQVLELLGWPGMVLDLQKNMLFFNDQAGAWSRLQVQLQRMRVQLVLVLDSLLAWAILSLRIWRLMFPRPSSWMVWRTSARRLQHDETMVEVGLRMRPQVKV